VVVTAAKSICLPSVQKLINHWRYNLTQSEISRSDWAFTVWRGNRTNFWLAEHEEESTQNYWVFWTFSVIRYSREYKTRRFGNWICLRPQVKGGEDTYSVGLLRKSWVCVFSPFTWGWKQFQLPKRRVFYSLEYRTMGKVQKPSNPLCYTPSSEPFTVYMKSDFTMVCLWSTSVGRCLLSRRWIEVNNFLNR
jgi:hypothetical protein